MPLAGELVRASDAIPDTSLPFTPVWSAVTTAPVLGNGSLTGSYVRVGVRVWVKIVLVTGSTTTYGSGFYRFSLPVTPAVNGLLPAFANDLSAARRYRMTAWINLASATGDNMRLATDDGVSGGASPSAPFTWAAGDTLIIDGSYEAA